MKLLHNWVTGLKLFSRNPAVVDVDFEIVCFRRSTEFVLFFFCELIIIASGIFIGPMNINYMENSSVINV